jgi:hypothetical protein
VGWLLLAPVVVVAAISIVAALRRLPRLPGVDPEQLRTVVEWRDPPAQAHDIAGDPAEQLRQIVGALAEHHFILSSSIDRGAEPSAVIDVRDLRFSLHVRTHGAGKWLLWINERGTSPADTDDLRQLLSGLYRTLEERRGEGTRWHRREQLGRGEGAPTPFYVV